MYERTSIETFTLPDLGTFDETSGLTLHDKTVDGRFVTGQNGVRVIAATGDEKVNLIGFENHTLAYVKSALDYPAYYPVHPIHPEKPVRAVLMDLDGTSVRSEKFWVWIIQKTTASILKSRTFELEEEDLPFVSGHSVSEHLQYCIAKYRPDASLEEARSFYFDHTHREMGAILRGKGRAEAFTPTPGLKEFLFWLKSKKIKIGLVTSGLYEKAYPEILAAFRSLGMGKPEDFYDAIITAGFPLRKGQVGTLGELSPKPHPWLYAEVARIGLGIPFEARHAVVGIEDSGAGVTSVRLAGFPTIGLAGGNIMESGTLAMTTVYCHTLQEIIDWMEDSQ